MLHMPTLLSNQNTAFKFHAHKVLQRRLSGEVEDSHFQQIYSAHCIPSFIRIGQIL